jgi:flagellar protein FlbD
MGVCPHAFTVGWHVACVREWRTAVIRLTRFDGSEFYLNAQHIQTVESTPDTHILLTNGQRYVARESAADVAERSIAYQRRVHCGGWERAQAG